MRLASWIVGEMRKECLVAGTVIIVGRRLDWGILHAVALRVANRLYTSYRNWYDARAVWMVVSCHRAARSECYQSLCLESFANRSVQQWGINNHCRLNSVLAFVWLRSLV